MESKVNIAKRALNACYLELHEAIADDLKLKVLAAFQEIREDTREDTIAEVMEILFKQMNSMTYDNGYPIKAVPQAILASLPQLMEISKHSHQLSLEHILRKFPQSFTELYKYDALAHTIAEYLAHGGDVYEAMTTLITNYNTVFKRLTKAVAFLPTHEAQNQVMNEQ